MPCDLFYLKHDGEDDGEDDDEDGDDLRMDGVAVSSPSDGVGLAALSWVHLTQQLISTLLLHSTPPFSHAYRLRPLLGTVNLPMPAPANP